MTSDAKLLDERFAAFRAACARDGAAGDYTAYACAGGPAADALQTAWTRTFSTGCLAWAQRVLADGGCACRVLSAGHCLWLWHGRPLPAAQYAAHALREYGASNSSNAGRALVAALRVVCHALLCPDVARACSSSGYGGCARRREMEGLASAVAQVGTAFGFIKTESVLMVEELTFVWHAAGLV